jgi:hypothetical protein
MKILNQPLHQLFQTKKKLSNARHVHWIIAFVVAIGLGYLFIMIEFVKTHDRRVLFYNLKTTVLSPETDHSAVFNNKSPVFIVYADKIVFGTVDSLVLPKLKKDSLILSKENFQEDFNKKIDQYKRAKDIFPAKVVGVLFSEPTGVAHSSSRREPTGDAAGSIELINQILLLIKNKNAQDSNPSVVLLDTLPAQ